MAYFNFYARAYTTGQKAIRAFLHIWRFPPAKLYLAAILLAQIVAWLQALDIKRRISGELVVLHYNIDFGVDLIGEPSRIYYFPAVGLAICLLNLFLVSILCQRRESRPLTHLFLGSALIFSIFLILALLALNMINFR